MLVLFSLDGLIQINNESEFLLKIIKPLDTISLFRSLE